MPVLHGTSRRGTAYDLRNELEWRHYQRLSPRIHWCSTKLTIHRYNCYIALYTETEGFLLFVVNLFCVFGSCFCLC